MLQKREHHTRIGNPILGTRATTRALQRFVARDATRWQLTIANWGACMLRPPTDLPHGPGIHLFSLFISIPLHSIITSATIFWHIFFSPFQVFPFTFYYIWSFHDNFYIEIILKRFVNISCVIKSCVRNLPDNISIQFVLISCPLQVIRKNKAAWNVYVS